MSQEPVLADSAIQAAIAGRVAAGYSTGIVVGVLRPDGRRQFFAEGSSGRPGVALDRHTVLEIGSITKAFTGTLLAQMIVAGEVALDDPVAKFLPDSIVDTAQGDRPITLIDLATHTSGLPRLPGNLEVHDPANPYASYLEANLLRFLDGITLQRDTSARYGYSNLGAGLLGYVLAQRAGGSYGEVLTTRLLTPASLQDTRITLSPAMQHRLAIGHDGEGAPVSNWDLSILAGAGALRSTAEDMLSFLQDNMDPGAPLAEAYRLAREPRREAGPGMRVGLGWHIRAANGRSIVWHNGGTGGYQSFAAFDPEAGTAVIVLSNSTSTNDDIGWHIVDPRLPLVASRSVAPIVLAPETLEQYAGVYEFAPGFSITVTRDGDRLLAQATGQPRFRLYASAPGEFFLRSVEARLTFEQAADGSVSGLVLHQGGRNTPGKRVR
jgi:CubicO group peptidase (beta-lactamase class C family)